MSANLKAELHIIYLVIINCSSYRDPNGGSCPTSPACGAVSPAYLLKPHPDNLAPGASKEATICYTIGKTCCAKTQQIMIRKCNGFFIYKLPRACIKRARYCGNGGTLLGFRSSVWVGLNDIRNVKKSLLQLLWSIRLTSWKYTRVITHIICQMRSKALVTAQSG